jgi:hypothetical protein
MEEYEFKVDIANLPFFWTVTKLAEVINRAYTD